MKASCLLIVGLASCAVLAQDNKPIVDTHFGKLEGDTSISREGRMYYQFKGIPYAKAPERFQAPEMPSNWEGIRDASTKGPVCPQFHPKNKEFIGSENCLNLNVYTPKLPQIGEHTILLPVVVILDDHGSSEKLGAKYLMDEDIILITLNSRVGIFGFLNTGDMYSQGNMGLKDQTAALRWIAGNIEKFGGDSKRITLLGSSNGGSDVTLHLFNPLSKGLFHSAIAQSGNGLSPIPSSFTRNPITQAKKLGVQVGCPIDSSKVLVECLKRMEPSEILKKMTKLNPVEFNSEDQAWFGPSVEKILEGQTEGDVAISAMPFKLLTEGKIVNKVPLIMGVNDFDGLCPLTAKVLNSTEALKTLNENWEEIGSKILFYKDSAKDAKLVSKKIRDFYFGDKEINIETRDALLKLYTDRYYTGPARYTARKLAKHIPVYLYTFNHKPTSSFLDLFDFPKELSQGAAHLDEMQYLVNLDFQAHKDGLTKKEITKESDEKEFTLSKGMVQLWSSFIETGKPTRTWGEGKEWTKVDQENNKLRWYNINLQTKMMDEPEDFSKRVEFWHALYSDQLTPELSNPKDEQF